MSSLLPSVTIAPLVAGPSFDAKTSTLWVQLLIGAGVYNVGGIPVGMVAYANAQTVDTKQFLQADITGETANNYTYKYIPATDLLQIFNAGTELTASAIIPSQVLNDIIVGSFVYNRL